MNNIQLPVTGANNWGKNLNYQIEKLSNRLTNAEKALRIVEGHKGTKFNIGHAGSGVVGTNNLIEGSYKEGKLSITFKGNIFIGGDINTYWEDVNIYESPVENLDHSSAYYIILKYNNTKNASLLSNEKKNELFQVIAQKDDKLSYLDVLLGYYYKEVFTPCYYSSSKSLMEHKYNRSLTWVDLLDTNISISYAASDGSVTASCTPEGRYKFYSDGIGTQTPTAILDSSALDERTFQFKNSSVSTYIADINNNISFTTSNTFAKENVGNYYRILLTVTGHLILQKSEYNGIGPEDRKLLEQLLYNVQFVNKLEQINKNGSINISLEPSIYVEIGRFYIKGKPKEDISYSQGLNQYTDYNLYFVPALNRGVVAQQSKNAWATTDGLIITDTIHFKNNILDLNKYYFTFDKDDTYIQKDKMIIPDFLLSAAQIYNTKSTRKEELNALCDKYKDFIEAREVILNGFKITFRNNISISENNLFTKTFTNIMVEDGNGQLGEIAIDIQEFKTLIIGYDYPPEVEGTQIKTISPNYDIVIDTIGNCISFDTRVCQNVGTKNVLFRNNVLDENYIFNFNKNDIRIKAPNFDLISNDQGTVLENTTLNVKTGLTLRGDDITINNKLNTNSLTIHTLNGASHGNVSYIQVATDLHMSQGKKLIYDSDRRLKFNFQELNEDYRNIVSKTPIVAYQYKDNLDTQEVGIIAQDLEKNLSENITAFVNTRKTSRFEDEKSINESKLIYILWKALQEEISYSKSLETRLSNLESKSL